MSVGAAYIWALRLNSHPGRPAGKGKANFALEDILNRNGSDNRLPDSRNERAHLTGLVFTGGGVSACEV